MAFFQFGRWTMRRPKRRDADVEGELDGFFDLGLVGARVDFEDVLILASEDGRLFGDDGPDEDGVGVQFVRH